MKYIHSVLFVLFSICLYGQNELPTGQIEVIKDFEVRLVETKKIKIIPAPVGIDSTVRRYEYKLLAPSPSIDYVVPELKPLAITPEKKSLFYPLFAKAGYGSPNSLLALLSYDHVQGDYLDWGIDFRHLSANNKKIPLQKFADSQARLNATYLLTEDVLIDAYVDAKFEKHFFYGAEDIPNNPDFLKRSFNRYDLNVNISNGASNATSFRYMALFNYLFDKDDLRTKERSLRVGGEVGTSIGAQEFPLGLKVVADITTIKDNESQALNNILIDPYFKFHTGHLKVHAGATLLLRKEQNKFLPDLEVAYNLFDNMLSIRAGWKGEVVKNSFHHLSMYNPYIQTRLDSITNMISRHIYAGLKGTSGNILYEVTGSYTKFERMAFFLQEFDDEEQFKPYYDNGSFIGIEGSLQFTFLKYVTLRSSAFTRFYSLDELEKPYHRPSLGIDAMLSYTGGDDIYHASILFHGENGLPYRTVGGTETRLDPLLDLSVHGDYYFTSAIGAFAEINNILGNNRERWVNYPTFGFNAKAGVMVRF
ncbi:MAG: hypothetical protein M3R25_04380 [Bacteroidota bacterium]|nr:hypothetical protein [Bacteroidota bacterium]